MDKITIQSIKKVISTKKNILLIPHSSPDADALGSCLSLFHFFKDEHNVNVISPNEFTDILSFLPGSNDILIFESDKEKSNILFKKYNTPCINMIF